MEKKEGPPSVKSEAGETRELGGGDLGKKAVVAEDMAGAAEHAAEAQNGGRLAGSREKNTSEDAPEEEGNEPMGVAEGKVAAQDATERDGMNSDRSKVLQNNPAGSSAGGPKSGAEALSEFLEKRQRTDTDDDDEEDDEGEGDAGNQDTGSAGASDGGELADASPQNELDHGTGPEGKSIIEFALEQNWHSSYVRTRHKNLRCFPFCSPLHRERSFCGLPITVFVKAPNIQAARKLHLVGRFRRARGDPFVMPGGQLQLLTKKDSKLVIGAFMQYNPETGTALFEFAPPRKWRYHCDQNKYTGSEQHAFTAYVFDQGGVCTEVKDSPHFRIVSAWRQSVNTVSRPFNPYASGVTPSHSAAPDPVSASALVVQAHANGFPSSATTAAAAAATAAANAASSKGSSSPTTVKKGLGSPSTSAGAAPDGFPSAPLWPGGQGYPGASSMPPWMANPSATPEQQQQQAYLYAMQMQQYQMQQYQMRNMMMPPQPSFMPPSAGAQFPMPPVPQGSANVPPGSYYPHMAHMYAAAAAAAAGGGATNGSGSGGYPSPDVSKRKPSQPMYSPEFAMHQGMAAAMNPANAGFAAAYSAAAMGPAGHSSAMLARGFGSKSKHMLDAGSAAANQMMNRSHSGSHR